MPRKQTKPATRQTDQSVDKTKYCRHPLMTYFEGVTQIPENSPYDQTKSNYDAEQRQRMIETMIRRYKRLRDGSVDPTNREKYALKVKQWEGMLKRHLAENPDFRRKPEREKINPEPMYKMDRREQNTGVFSSYPEPMQKRHVIKVANEAGINLSGITVKIQRNPHLIAKNIFGIAAVDQIGRIDLFPDAFKSKEDLIRTVFHEKIHVSQFEEYGVKFVQNNRARFETEAYMAEDAFIVNLRKDGKI